MKIKLYSLIRFIVVCSLGVLSHFLYDLSDENNFIGIFSAQNESTWEHLKLLFFPMLLVTIIELIFFRQKAQDFLPARVMGILTGLLFIIVIFYTFWGISGKLIDFINISIYFIAVISAFKTEQIYRTKQIEPALSVSIAILVTITLLFIIFSFNTPNIGIFYDLALHPKG